MGWLGTRWRGRWPFGRSKWEAPEGGPSTGEDQPRSGAGAPLVLLVPDAAGLACYRPYVFDGVAEAGAFLEFWYPDGAQPRVVAFWALSGDPELRAGDDIEAVVLIQERTRPGTVYLFSFVEMELALAFVRREVPESDLELVQLYWAVPVTVERNRWGSIRLSPLEPPPVARREARAVPFEKAAGTPGSTAAAHSWALPAVEPHRWEPKDEASQRLEPTEEGPEAAEEASPSSREMEELFSEVWEALRARRWETREGPFQGFGSPPGKF